MKGLQSVNNAFGKDDRFVIISLCQTADEEFLKNLSAEGATRWMQGNVEIDSRPRRH